MSIAPVAPSHKLEPVAILWAVRVVWILAITINTLDQESSSGGKLPCVIALLVPWLLLTSEKGLGLEPRLFL